VTRPFALAMAAAMVTATAAPTLCTVAFAGAMRVLVGTTAPNHFVHLTAELPLHSQLAILCRAVFAKRASAVAAPGGQVKPAKCDSVQRAVACTAIAIPRPVSACVIEVGLAKLAS
jgi:hypothetical protein